MSALSRSATGLTLNPNQVFSYSPGATDQVLSEYEFYGSAGTIFFQSYDTVGAVTQYCMKGCAATSVSEPGSVVLMGLALLGFVAFRPKRVRLH